MKIKIAPGRRYECFECGFEYVVPMGLERCPRCEEEDNFHRMS